LTSAGGQASVAAMFPIRDHNPSERTPLVTWALIAINAVVFLLMLPGFGDDRLLSGIYAEWALIPARLSAGEGHVTVLTSMFMHGGFMHFAGNMLFLYIFGDNLEDQFGRVPFLLFYLACGVAAAMAQYVADPASPIPMVGASGAIAGVMGGYLFLFPRAQVDVLVILGFFIRLVPLPAWIMLGLWFGLQVVLGAVNLGGQGGGVAYLAHAGGFAAGFAVALVYLTLHGGTGFWRRTEGHPPHPEVSYRRTTIPIVRRR
jgi:membrane associated rhomboid family serine protease